VKLGNGNLRPAGRPVCVLCEEFLEMGRPTGRKNIADRFHVRTFAEDRRILYQRRQEVYFSRSYEVACTSRKEMGKSRDVLGLAYRPPIRGQNVILINVASY